jgi:putative tryptophan/tyrosine transport system substrate-binding protein
MHKTIPLFIAALFGSACILWLGIAVPLLRRLPANFTYSADVLSIDNFYDEEKGAFTGATRSVTRFTYDVIGKVRGALLVRNVFDVRTVSGEKIFSVERLYGIDPRTGRHVAGLGDRDRTGYLFAPRHLRRGAPFTSWHINYDGPAHLTFAGAEQLFGLPVYRYETRYQGVRIDQTKNLGHLPGVPEERGVELEPYLQLWVEPVSGRVVNYRDETTAYYYDRQTGKRLHPWNMFRNMLTRESTREQVDIARRMKISLRLSEVVIPSLFALAAGIALLSLHAPRVAAAGMALGMLCALGYVGALFSPPPSTESFTIGIAPWIRTPEAEENLAGFKESLAAAGFVEGRNLRIIEESAEGNADRQQNILRDFLARHVQLIYTLTTPGTRIAKEYAGETPIVFSLISHPVDVGLVASLGGSRNTLVGTRNWVPAQEQLATFRELYPDVRSIGFVRLRSDPDAVIQYNEMVTAARERGIAVVDLAAGTAAELPAALASARPSIDAVYAACGTSAPGGGDDATIAFVTAEHLPSFACAAAGVRNGHLVGTVAGGAETGRRAGEKAAAVLAGAPPEVLETSMVERPFILLNERRAHALGISFPQGLLAEVKEIVR